MKKDIMKETINKITLADSLNIIIKLLKVNTILLFILVLIFGFAFLISYGNLY